MGTHSPSRSTVSQVSPAAQSAVVTHASTTRQTPATVSQNLPAPHDVEEVQRTSLEMQRERRVTSL